MYYLKNVYLSNICCIENIKLNFLENDDRSNIILFLCDNGTGKSTLLRCIALGLSDAPSSTGLIQELYSDLIKKDEKEACIRIEIASDDLKKSFCIETKLEKTHDDNIKVVQNTRGDDFASDKIFACGYGAARGSYGQKPISEYSLADSVYSLFNYDHKL